MVKLFRLSPLHKQFNHFCKPRGAAVSFLLLQHYTTSICLQLYNQRQSFILLLSSHGLEISKTWQSLVNVFHTSPRRQTYWPLYYYIYPGSILARKAPPALAKLIHASGSTKWKLRQWPNTCDNSKAKSACIDEKHLSRKLYTRVLSSALASLPYPRK